jgi:regulator of cell morphogenesis and NO signaling
MMEHCAIPQREISRKTGVPRAGTEPALPADMTIAPDVSLARIVLAHPATALVFQRHGLDFCCRGETPLGDACAARGLAVAEVIAEVERAIADRAPRDLDPGALSTPELIRHVVDRHHRYLRATLPALRPLADKVARVHGPHEPRLVPLAATFHAIADALVPHLDQEEEILFPALTAAVPDAAVVARELASMHEDHLAVGTMLGELRDLSDGFTTPEWGCTSYRTLMAELEALELDVLRHVHLENHVLMPRFLPARVAA